MVASDHILCGISRDAIDYLFEVLQGRDRRENVDDAFIRVMRLCNLKCSYRLLNRDTGKLHNLTMSDMYTVLSVEDCALAEVESVSISTLPMSCCRAFKKFRAFSILRTKI